MASTDTGIWSPDLIDYVRLAKDLQRMAQSIDPNMKVLLDSLVGDGTVDATDVVVAALLGSGEATNPALDNTTADHINDADSNIRTTLDGYYTAIDSVVIDARNHGVVGDGITDDGPALQTLIDSLPTDGGTILIPEVVQTSIGLQLGHRVQLRGHNGRASRIRTSADITLISRDPGTTATDGIVITDLLLQRQNGSAVTPLVDLTGARYTVLDRVELSQSGGVASHQSKGIYIGDMGLNNVLNSVQIRGFGDGIHIGDGSNANKIGLGVNVMNCHNGIVINGGNSNILVGCAVHTVTGDGVHVTSGTNYRATGNTLLGVRVEDVGGYCFNLPSGQANPPIWNTIIAPHASPHSGQEQNWTGANPYLHHRDLVQVATFKRWQLRTYVDARRGPSGQTIPASEWTAVSWNQQQEDHLGERVGSVVKVQEAGIYQVNIRTRLDPDNPDSEVRVAININGSRQMLESRDSSDGINILSGAISTRLEAGDEVGTDVFIAGGGLLPAGYSALQVQRLP